MDIDLQIVKVGPAYRKHLIRFFSFIRKTREDRYFYPHPFTDRYASDLSLKRNHKQDLYYIILLDSSVAAYGMLRGYDEGYQIPSLGIIVHPYYRGMGLSRLFMSFLHKAAKLRGAKKIRLTVDKKNDIAKALYEKLGYNLSLEYDSDDYYVGILDL